MDFTDPHFTEPRWLWLSILAPLLVVVLHHYAERARSRQLARVASPHFVKELTRSHSPARRFSKTILIALAFAASGVALARPQWGVRQDATQLLADDMMIALDCSRSMLAADVSPNRLDRARLAIKDFVRRFGRGRAGLVAFAGQAFLQCPLTFDHSAFYEALDAVDEESIPVQGTDIGRALDESFLGMEKTDRNKVIILITDGEDLDQRGVPVAQQLATNGIVVFTIGVGTENGAEIQVLNDQGQMELVRDSRGEVVRSHLDEKTLRGIADATGGRYYPLGPLGEGLAKVGAAIQEMKDSPRASPARKLGVDRFHVPIALALVLLVAESLIGTRRRDGKPAAIRQDSGVH